MVQMQDLHSPELDKVITLNHQEALVGDSLWNYDMTIGRDFILCAGIVLNFDLWKVQWFGESVDMQSKFELTAENLIVENLEDDGLEQLNSFVSTILDAKYERVNPNIVAKN